MFDEPIIKEKPRNTSGSRLQLNLVIFLVIAIGVLVAVPYYFLSRMKEPEFLLRSYTYAPVETRTFIRKLAVSGNVKPEEILTVKLESEGMLQELFVQAGDDVKEGDLIATIDTSNLRESLAEAEDALLKAQNKVNELLLNKKIQDKNNEKTIVSLEEQLNSLKETLALQEKLYEIGAISLKDLQDAENAVKKAQNELDSKLKNSVLMMRSSSSNKKLRRMLWPRLRRHTRNWRINLRIQRYMLQFQVGYWRLRQLPASTCREGQTY